jgi:hypothetical protein
MTQTTTRFAYYRGQAIDLQSFIIIWDDGKYSNPGCSNEWPLSDAMWVIDEYLDGGVYYEQEVVL